MGAVVVDFLLATPSSFCSSFAVYAVRSPARIDFLFMSRSVPSPSPSVLPCYLFLPLLLTLGGLGPLLSRPDSTPHPPLIPSSPSLVQPLNQPTRIPSSHHQIYVTAGARIPACPYYRYHLSAQARRSRALSLSLPISPPVYHSTRACLSRIHHRASFISTIVYKRNEKPVGSFEDIPCAV